MIGAPTEEQRLIYYGKQVEDTRSLSDYGVVPGDTIHLAFRLCGGVPPPERMSLAAGGSFGQTIFPDKLSKKWLP